MPDAPVFIVGTPRSGTTLLAAFLSSHSRLDCGPETHFFGYLAQEAVGRLLAPRHWPERAVRFLTAMTLNGSPVHRLFNRSAEELTAFLKDRPPAVPAMLEALTAGHARAAGKVRWVEKTPNHLLEVEALRRFYPSAPVVRIVRDPRDAAVSMRKLPWASRSVLANLYLCDEWLRRSARFFERDANALTVVYEELMADPRGQLERLCGFLGESFEPGMLATGRAAEALTAGGEWWKKNVGQALDASRVQAWRREMPPELVPAAELVCHEWLERFRYPHTHRPQHTLAAYPLDQDFIERAEDVLVRAAAHGIRLARADLGELPDKEPLVLCGLPPLHGSPLRKLDGARRYCQLLLSRRARGRPCYRLAPPPAASGKVARGCALLARIAATPADADGLPEVARGRGRARPGVDNFGASQGGRSAERLGLSEPAGGGCPSPASNQVRGHP
jgi:hypothetical protein